MPDPYNPGPWRTEHHKSLTTLVPFWARWVATDGDGGIWIYSARPRMASNGRYWLLAHDGDYSMQIGLGPAPQNPESELYRLEAE